MRGRAGRVLTAILLVPVLSSAGPVARENGERHSLFSKLLERHVENGLVDYTGFREDPSFQTYLDLLASTDPASMPDRNDQLALWINAYNAYTIKLIVDRLPLSSIRDIGLGLPVVSGPWSIAFARVGGKEYTLNEIEHDIIRGQFRDARVHFALVCASMSCPKLRREAYEGGRLDEQLEDDARRFMNDDVLNRFDAERGVVSLSKIFDWYESDFEESAGSVRLFILRYVDSQEERDLLWREEVEIVYLPYDWSLNRK
jgi:hypothetical protein